MDFFRQSHNGKPEARDHPTCASAIFRSITIGNVTEWLRHFKIYAIEKALQLLTYLEGNVIATNFAGLN